MKYELDFGYDVIETTDGIDVYCKNGDFVCELSGKSLADYTHNGEVDDYALIKAIDHTVAAEELLLIDCLWY